MKSSLIKSLLHLKGLKLEDGMISKGFLLNSIFYFFLFEILFGSILNQRMVENMTYKLLNIRTMVHDNMQS